MPREGRKKSRSGVYHIMLRGINRQTIFEDEEDRRKFLLAIKKYKGISQFKLYGYCLMDNHAHLLMKEVGDPISDVIKRVSSSYVYWYNFKYERVGHLFQGRFKSENVESAKSFLTVLRYIHQNPLKAGLANSVFESKWTSLDEYIKNVDMVNVDLGLQLFAEDRERAIPLFMEYMQQQNNDQCLDDHVKVRMSDSEVREYLNEIGITNSSMLQQLERGERDRILMLLKELKGVNIRQISRVTGISKSVIHRLR